MTSTPRLPNGQPPAEKMPGVKPRKASGKKPPKKIAAEPAIAKPVEMAKPAPIKSVAASVKPQAPAMPLKSAMPPKKTPMPPLPALDGAVESSSDPSRRRGRGRWP